MNGGRLQKNGNRKYEAEMRNAPNFFEVINIKQRKKIIEEDLFLPRPLDTDSESNPSTNSQPPTYYFNVNEGDYKKGLIGIKRDIFKNHTDFLLNYELSDYEVPIKQLSNIL